MTNFVFHGGRVKRVIFFIFTFNLNTLNLLQHPGPVTPEHGRKPNKSVVFYSRDLRIVPEKFLLLRQLVFPSHNVTKHLVFCIQCDSHHWFVEEWHQVSSSRIADGL